MRNSIRRTAAAGPAPAALAFAVVLLAGGCVTMRPDDQPELRMPEDAPLMFVTEDGDSPVQECRAVLLDPRDNSRVRLVRSAQLGAMYRGDYEVAAGRYGVRERELLRINCETGAAIGIVPAGT
jgi:hypothetical protein